MLFNVLYSEIVNVNSDSISSVFQIQAYATSTTKFYFVFFFSPSGQRSFKLFLDLDKKKWMRKFTYLASQKLPTIQLVVNQDCIIARSSYFQVKLGREKVPIYIKKKNLHLAGPEETFK